MPNAQDALAQLSLNVGDPYGLVAARRNKEHALLEMRRSLELQASDPRHTFSGATNANIADEQASLNESPDFGTDEQKRISDIQHTNDEVNAFNNPDTTAMRREKLANELALKTVPNVEASKQAGKNALELSAQNAQQEKDQNAESLKAYLGVNGAGRAGGQSTVHIGPDGKPSVSIAPAKQPGQLEQRTLTMIKEAQPIIDRLSAELGNPSSDPLSQLLSKGRNMGSKALYDQGLSNGDQTKVQLQGLLRVLGSSAYVVGSRSYQLIQQAMEHLSNSKGSDAFNKHQIDEIRALWPQMLAEVQEAHANPMGPIVSPDTLAPPTSPQDPLGIR